VRIFRSFADAERADDAFYASLTPQQRVDLLLDLIAAYTEQLGGSSEGLAGVHRVIPLSQS